MRRVSFLLVGVCSTLFLVNSAIAQEFKQTGITETQQETSGLTESQKKALEEKAGRFGLKIEEFQKYESIMKGPRGFRSTNANPIAVLGAEAQTAEERKRYAEMAARSEFRMLEQDLAFQREYSAAHKRLFGNMKAINPKALDGDLKSIRALQGEPRSGDRILYFTYLDCEACIPYVQKLTNYVSDKRGIALDIYFIDSGGEDAKIQNWAREQQLSPALVRQRKVTLNHDQGKLNRIDGTKIAPSALVRRGSFFYDFSKAVF